MFDKNGKVVKEYENLTYNQKQRILQGMKRPAPKRRSGRVQKKCCDC